MKRLLHIQFLLVLLLALGYSPLQAKRITQWQAQQQAYSFWGKQMPQKAKAKSRTAITASPSDAYYVFNNDAGGFVIIAGDDAVTPVLGYTSTGSFDAENLPDGLKDLLKSYERQIAALGDNYVANQTATRAAFTGEKLLKTAEWEPDGSIQQVYAKQLCNRLCSNGWSYRDETSRLSCQGHRKPFLYLERQDPLSQFRAYLRLGKHAC